MFLGYFRVTPTSLLSAGPLSHCPGHSFLVLYAGGGECFKGDCGVGGVCEPGFGSYTCECLAGYYEVVVGDGNCIGEF